MRDSRSWDQASDHVPVMVDIALIAQILGLPVSGRSRNDAGVR